VSVGALRVLWGALSSRLGHKERIAGRARCRPRRADGGLSFAPRGRCKRQCRTRDRPVPPAMVPTPVPPASSAAHRLPDVECPAQFGAGPFPPAGTVKLPRAGTHAACPVMASLRGKGPTPTIATGSFKRQLQWRIGPLERGLSGSQGHWRGGHPGSDRRRGAYGRAAGLRPPAGPCLSRWRRCGGAPAA
jgi:hypothetical protein